MDEEPIDFAYILWIIRKLGALQGQYSFAAITDR